MRKTWVVVLAFIGLAVFVTGCGGSKDKPGYEDPYGSAMGNTPGSRPAPAATDATGDTASAGGIATGDPTASGTWGVRKHTGGGQEGLGGVVSEAALRELESVGRDVAAAHKLYQQYMTKKNVDGTKDTGLLNSAVAALEQLMPRIDALLDKYPDSPAVQESFKTANDDLRALKYEQE